MAEIEDLNIPDDAAALVLYADGSAAMHLPKMTGDDAPVPDHVLAIAAFGALVARAPDRVEDLITEFENGQWFDEVRH